MSSSRNVRLRGTHKILINRIEGAELNYLLTVRELDSMDARIKKYLDHVELAGPKLTPYYRLKIERDLGSFGMIFPTPQTVYRATYIKFLSDARGKLAGAKRQALHFAIVNLCNVFDEFLFRLAFKYYEHNPERMRSEIKVNFDQILTMLESYNVEYELVKVMVFKKMFSANLADRYEFIAKTLSATGLALKPKKDLQELYLVRNSIVHNGDFVGEQLSKQFPRYLGYKKLELQYEDYLKFKKVILGSAQGLRMLFVVQNPQEPYGFSYYTNIIQSNKDAAVALRRLKAYKGKLVYTGTDLDILKRLSKKQPKSFYRTTSSLLNSHIFEYKYLAVCLLKRRWDEAGASGYEVRNEIARYVLKNLNLLSLGFLVNRFTAHLTWYIENTEKSALFVLVDSTAPSHRKLAIAIFEKADLISKQNFGIRIFQRLPLHSGQPEVKKRLNLYLTRLKTKNYRAYQKAKSMVRNDAI